MADKPSNGRGPAGPEDLALRGELSANVVGFCRLLRREGAGPGAAEAADALLALERVDLGAGRHFYEALRTCLAKSRREQEIFDSVFDSYWKVWDRAGELLRGQEETREEEEENREIRNPCGPEQQPALRAVTAWLKGEKKTGDEEPAPGYSPFEVMARRDFAGFRADELDEIGHMVALIARILARRFNRRYRDSSRRGRLDLRRTLRRNLRRGGELVDLSFRRRRRRRLKLVLLCDVSRSMDLYSSFLIQFVYAFQLACRRVEAFVFSTSMKRVTETLDNEDLDEVLAALTHQVPQWSGGTRIGASLRTFLDGFGDALLDNQTVVILLSDGWDTGDIDLLRDAMREIHRRSLAVIWLNPLLGSEEYRPDTRGMRAALPHVDLFAPAHNAASLKELASILGRVQRRDIPARFGFHQREEVEGAEAAMAPEADTPRPSSAANLERLGREMQEKRQRRKDQPA